MVRLRLEAEAVVADLDDHVSRSLLDADPGPARLRVLDHVAQRLAPDAEDLRLSARGERDATIGRMHLDRGPLAPGEPRRVADERGDETILERVTAQLGDDVADIGLRAEGQIPDRPQVPREPLVPVRALLSQCLLGRTG